MIIIRTVRDTHPTHPNAIRVDRRTSLGNPWPMENRTPTERERVIAMYARATLPTIENTREFADIVDRERHNVTTQLTCHCYPYHCHADTIAEHARRYLKRTIYRVIVAGTRQYDDATVGVWKLSELWSRILPHANWQNTEIVSGKCPKGGDRFGEIFAAQNQIPCRLFPADWNTHGLSAGPIRNDWMLKFAMHENPVVIAFWHGRKSGGTWDMIRRARRAKLYPYIIPV